MAIFSISRVKNLSTAGPRANLRFREETKGHLSHKWLGQRPCLSRIIFESLVSLPGQKRASRGRQVLPGHKLASFSSRPAPMAILSRLASISMQWPFYQDQWPFYQANVKEEPDVQGF